MTMRSALLLCLSLMVAVGAPTELTAQVTTQDGFALPQKGKVFEFPRDHGSHGEFRTEWWYITGHLDAEDGTRYGFQVTFFRQGRKESGSVQYLHLAHSALLDTRGKTFLHEERLNREGWDASSSATTLDVRNGNWTLQLEESTGRLRLAATVKNAVRLNLELQPTKPLVIFGQDGVSYKGSSAEAASHYLTWPRLAASGQLRIGDKEQTVHGEAWMDHEFSSSQLDEGQAGWDWGALQLQDGRELMVYRMRRTDGTMDKASTLAVIDPKGAVRQLDSARFKWEALSRWKSPRNGADYPNHVRIQYENETFELRPLAEDQEQDGGITQLPYWEGACDVLDTQGQVVGRAFLELAGYAGDLSRHLSPEKATP